MYFDVCACVYIYVHTYVHIHVLYVFEYTMHHYVIRIHIFVCTCMHIYVLVCIYMHVHMSLCTYLYVHQYFTYRNCNGLAEKCSHARKDTTKHLRCTPLLLIYVRKVFSKRKANI